MSDTSSRSGFVALIGAPNAGKSTLLNALVGEKVSIVTHKVQTTRSNVRGIRVHDGAQIIFVDTPGIFAPKRTLDRAMVHAAWTGAEDADLVALLVDVERGIGDDTRRILKRLRQIERPRIALLNKIDRIAREKLLALAGDLNELCEFQATFMISALHGDGLDDVLAWLAHSLPEGPFLYPAEDRSDQNPRLLAAEVTREKVFLRLHQELPYQCHVETEEWEERRDGSLRIGQTIYVARHAHKKIVLGRQGATVKQIGRQAREELGRLLGRKIHLFLFVKVRENWVEDPERYREMGLEYPS